MRVDAALIKVTASLCHTHADTVVDRLANHSGHRFDRSVLLLATYLEPPGAMLVSFFYLPLLQHCPLTVSVCYAWQQVHRTVTMNAYEMKPLVSAGVTHVVDAYHPRAGRASQTSVRVRKTHRARPTPSLADGPRRGSSASRRYISSPSPTCGPGKPFPRKHPPTHPGNSARS